jgi:hypothetical protein
MMTPQELEEISQLPRQIDREVLKFWRLINGLLGWAWITGTALWIIKIWEWFN